ncbi:hypothetical protein ACHAWF_002046 [Thalassiosira exigua]
MEPFKCYLLAIALGHSQVTIPCASSLQQLRSHGLQTGAIRDRNDRNANAAAASRRTKCFEEVALRTPRLKAHEDQNGDATESNRRITNHASEDDEDESDEEIINLNDYIDFEKMDKMFDDIPEYGVIRSLESPYENFNPVDQPSVDEIEAWMAKNDLQKQKQQRERRRRKFFPWVSPLISLLVPKKHLPSAATTSPRRGNGMKKLHSTFDNGLSSPKLFRNFVSKPNSARNSIVALNVVAFVYQIVTAVWYLPGFNRILAASVAGDAYSAAALAGDVPRWTPAEVVLRALGLAGGGAGVVVASGSSARGAAGRVVGRGPIAAHSMGPFFLDYAHQPYPLSHYQKHRYLSGGFLHGSLLHLGMNMRALLSLPSWLENGLGKCVYLSAYLVAIVTGNIAHTLSSMSGRAAGSLCIGASGGICGLYGLMLASLMKMGNIDAVYSVAKQMVWLLAFGFLVPNVSNAGHVGGFLGGWVVGYLFGPGYERSYSLNRSGGLSRDSADWQFRQMMGPGIYPNSEASILPLKYLWVGIGVALLARPDLRLIPIALLRGILEPGALSGARSLLRS